MKIILTTLAAAAVLALATGASGPSDIDYEQDVADDLQLITANDPYQRRKAAEHRQAERVRKAYEQGKRDAIADGCKRKLGRPIA